METVYTKMKAKNNFEISFTINTKPEEQKQPGWKLIKLWSNAFALSCKVGA